MGAKPGKIDTGLLGAIIGAAAAIIAAIITILFNPSGPVHPGIKPQGKILIPKNGGSVERHFLVSGELSDIPRGYQIWLAVEKENLIWPKEPMISPNDHRWSRMIKENSLPLGESFSLSLLCVSPKGQTMIEKWFAQGALTVEYPGLKEIEEISRLDIVNRITLRPGKKQPGISAGEEPNPFVYVTRTGRRYHREYCSALNMSIKKIRLSEAKGLGYTPCSRCKPPQL
jgi:hypothetical protein